MHSLGRGVSPEAQFGPRGELVPHKFPGIPRAANAAMRLWPLSAMRRHGILRLRSRSLAPLRMTHGRSRSLAPLRMTHGRTHPLHRFRMTRGRTHRSYRLRMTRCRGVRGDGASVHEAQGALACVSVPRCFRPSSPPCSSWPIRGLPPMRRARLQARSIRACAPGSRVEGAWLRLVAFS